MADQWYYRIFGQEFGPVPLNELKQLAESGTIAEGDEVRQEYSDQWKGAETVQDLAIQTTATAESPSDEAVTAQPIADEWYCRFNGQEFGPLRFQEVVDFTKGSQLTANDEVRFGVSGKWRRVGSIGRLVAVLPFQEPIPDSRHISPSPVPKPTSLVTPKTFVGSASHPVDSVQNLTALEFDRDLVRAEAAAEATEQAVRRLIGFTLSPGYDSAWWAAINGTECGPIAFSQLFEWALTGHLKPGDFIRNGLYGQYTHAANLGALFVAAALVKHSKEAIEQAKLKVTESHKLKASPVSPPPASTPPLSPTTAAPTTVSRPATAEPEAKRAAPDSKPMTPVELPQKTSTFESTGSPGAAVYSSTYRPHANPPRTFTPKRKDPTNSPLSKILGLIGTPIGKGAIAALLLASVGWIYMANRNNADIRRYKALKRVLDDVRAKRFVKSTDVEEIKVRAAKLTTELTPELKGGTSAVKKALLAATTDDLPKMMLQDLSTESNDEKNFVKHLNEVKKILKLK